MEFDSTYRNRNCYPCPAEFKTQITCTNDVQGGVNAQDYIAKSYPSTSWFQAPYAGEDLRAFAGDVGGTDQQVIKIPRSINNQTLTSLWPINWLDGSNPEYLSSISAAGFGPAIVTNRSIRGQSGWTSGSKGARFDTPLTAFGPGPTWNANFLNDRFIRIQNVVAPVNFSGGTPEAPQLGAIALQTGTIDNYFAGATLIRFTTNPLLEPLADPGNTDPLLGSLGQAFYYQTLTIDSAPPTNLALGDEIVSGAGNGYIACIISDTNIVVRVGSSTANAQLALAPPYTNAQWPPYSTTLPSFSVSDVVTLNGTAWGTVLVATDPEAQYRYCGFVETSIIASYEASSGKATLVTPFLSGGPNAFTPGVGNDFFLINFDTDPTGYWPQVQSGSPRLFFPGGANIPNYYSGVFLENITYDVNYANLLGVQTGKVSSYSVTNKLLFLDNKTKFQRAAPQDRGVNVISNNTVVYLSPSVAPELPVGSIVTYQVQTINPATGGLGATVSKPFRVALTKPVNGDAIVFVSSLDPTTAENPLSALGTAPSLTRLANPVPVRVAIPPWYKNIPLSGFGAATNLYDYWSNSLNWSTLTTRALNDGPVSFGGFFGAESIVVRGKNPIQPQQSLVPYEPLIAEATPVTTPFAVHNNSVFEIVITSAGQGYKPTAPGMPAMALIEVPATFLPPFTGMLPQPEIINGTYTFLNICWVDIISVDALGGITDVKINTPGYDYYPGSVLHIVQGEGGDISKQNAAGTAPFEGPNGDYTFRRQTGINGKIQVNTTYQSISVVGGEKFPSTPEPGCAVYMPTFGHGLNDTAEYVTFGAPGGLPTVTQYNQAPRIAEYIINFSQTTFGSDITLNQFNQYGRQLKNNQYPRRSQNCKVNDATFPETGLRIIDTVIRSRNNQIVIAKNISIAGSSVVNLQYYAPGTYLGGFWNILLPNGNPLPGQNNVLWLGLSKGYDLSTFRGRYSIARTEYVDKNLAWLPELPGSDAYPGQTINTDTNALAAQPEIAFIDHRIEPATYNNSANFAGFMNLSNLASANVLEILQFDRDSNVPLNYTGSTVSQNQMVCYEIELISLILPNKPLDNNIGGLIAFYPYLYVELSNVSAPSSGMKGIIYSNNPNANRALFRVGIDDTPTPEISAFIKVDGNGAVQTVKFKPNDNLYFRVYLQNGELFQTQTKDTIPPLEPDVFVQISAEFSIKRLT